LGATTRCVVDDGLARIGYRQLVRNALVSDFDGTITHHDRIAELFARTGFWTTVRAHGFSMREWHAAVQRAPTLRDDVHTVLSERECWPGIEEMIRSDDTLASCCAE
jgi:2-hydroxy-3-keto-5-methylthiopentenyl-1-phosphate phosphatase